MERNTLVIISAASMLASCQQNVEILEWTVSSRDHYFQQAECNVSEAVADAKTICIDPSDTAQTIKGFGTCFNELGWASLQLLPKATIEEIFTELYTPAGANFNRARMSMGANDFALDYYSPADTDGDFELRDFSIERDKQTLIPMMKHALNANPDIYWFASPWCPPRWMKKTKHYAERAVTEEMVERMKAREEARKTTKPGEAGGVSATSGFYNDGPLAFRIQQQVNDAVPGEEGAEGCTSFNMQPEYLDAYARLFGKFVEAYRAEGINIQMVMPQNEMNSAQPYPSCCWTSEDLNIFIGQYLGPEMEKHQTDIYFGTEERANPLLVDTLLQDPASSKYIKGVAFQWAGKDALPTIHQNYPDLDLVQSEQECGNGRNNWEGAMHSWDLQRHYLSNGVTQYYYWNTSLLADKPSRWGWFQNSLVTVNEEDKSWTFTPEYYELKHLSHYVKPGAKRLLLEGSTYDDMLGFINPDGSIALIVANQTEDSLPLNIKLIGKTFSINITPETLYSILFLGKANKW